MKLLITGGCGFLGSNLAAFYLEQGAEVVLADALFRSGSERNLRWLQQKAPADRLHFHHIDIAEEIALVEVFRRHAPFDFVCHVGGQVFMNISLGDPRRDMLTNVQGTFNVLEAVRRYSPDAFVAFSSTNKVYGDLEHLKYVETPTRFQVPACPRGFDESLPLDFSTPYGCSKGAADQYVRDWHRVYGIKTVVFRHSSIYGGRQFADFNQGWIGWFCQQAMVQKSAQTSRREVVRFTIAGSGKQVRDVLHASDIVRLYHAAFEHRQRVAGSIFNIGGGIENSLSLLELFDLLEKFLELREPLVFSKTPRRQSDQDFFVANVDKARSCLGWMPGVSAQDGIGRMLNWIEQCNADK